MFPMTYVHGAALPLIFNSLTERELWHKKAPEVAIINSFLIFLLTEFIQGIIFMLVSILTM